MGQELVVARAGMLQGTMSSIPNADTDGFDATFAQLARSTRARHALRLALHGGAIGLSVASAVVVVWTRFAALPVRGALELAGVGVGLGVVAALFHARRKAWTDSEVALYFDQKLVTHEAIVTAVELPLASSVRRIALSALRSAPRGAVMVRVLRRTHLAGLVAIVLFALATRLPPTPHVPRPKEPGDAAVVIANVPGLDAMERLATLSARDDAQRERLAILSKEAHKLHDDLAKGLEKRDAQDRAARLAESLRSERLTLGAGDERQGLETAIAALERDDTTRRAAAALGDHDLESMDRALERHANAREAQDRGRAKKALEEAEKAARNAGAPGVAKAIAEEKARLEKREARASALRQLAAAMGEAAINELRALDQAPSDANAEALASTLADVLSKMSEEDRAKLGAKLGESPKGASAKGLEALAKRAATPEGQKELERRLREMATEREKTSEDERDRALGEAQQGAEDLERALGSGSPTQGPGTLARSANAANGNVAKGGIPVPGGAPGAEGSAGSHHDTGRGNHAGATERLGSSAFKARARGPLNGAPLMPGTTTWKPGEAGGTADVVGRAGLGTAGVTEILGSDRSEVPEEYREQVHKYFRP